MQKLWRLMHKKGRAKKKKKLVRVAKNKGRRVFCLPFFFFFFHWAYCGTYIGGGGSFFFKIRNLLLIGLRRSSSAEAKADVSNGLAVDSGHPSNGVRSSPPSSVASSFVQTFNYYLFFWSVFSLVLFCLCFFHFPKEKHFQAASFVVWCAFSLVFLPQQQKHLSPLPNNIQFCSATSSSMQSHTVFLKFL